MEEEVAVVETERLRLRGWDPARDLGALAAINADPEVMRWIGGGRPIGRGFSDEMVRRFAGEWRERGLGLWAVSWKDDPEQALLGFCGLTAPSFLPAVLPAAEIGWRLARDVWGRGVATEAARAAVAWGFADGGAALREIVAVVAPGNERSLHVVEKLGMTARPDRWHAPSHGKVKVFGLRRER